MSIDIKTEVENWLDEHWDTENKRAVGSDTYDQKNWFTKVSRRGLRCADLAGKMVGSWPVVKRRPDN